MIAEFESRILALIDDMVEHASDDELFASGYLRGHLTLAEELTPEGHDADEDSGEKLEALFADAMSTGMCSPEELELLREFHLDGFSSTAVAERHGLSAAAVRQRVKRTRDRLAEVGRASLLVA